VGGCRQPGGVRRGGYLATARWAATPVGATSNLWPSLSATRAFVAAVLAMFAAATFVLTSIATELAASAAATWQLFASPPSWPRPPQPQGGRRLSPTRRRPPQPPACWRLLRLRRRRRQRPPSSPESTTHRAVDFRHRHGNPPFRR